jgi:hypothetical protein
LRLALALLLAGLPAEARQARHSKSAPSTVGLGRSCRKSSDCHHRSQRCLRESDMNGKPLDQGFCALPCLSLEAGTTKVVPNAPLDATAKVDLKRKAPPRCPPHFLCRGADAGSPIDMCVKE